MVVANGPAGAFGNFMCPVRSRCSCCSELVWKVSPHSVQRRVHSGGQCPATFACWVALLLLGNTCKQWLHRAGEGRHKGSIRRVADANWRGERASYSPLPQYRSTLFEIFSLFGEAASINAWTRQRRLALLDASCRLPLGSRTAQETWNESGACRHTVTV